VQFVCVYVISTRKVSKNGQTYSPLTREPSEFSSALVAPGCEEAACARARLLRFRRLPKPSALPSTSPDSYLLALQHLLLFINTQTWQRIHQYSLNSLAERHQPPQWQKKTAKSQSPPRRPTRSAEPASLCSPCLLTWRQVAQGAAVDTMAEHVTETGTASSTLRSFSILSCPD
jgi:hypothetical protein